jgi:hypothetical protein
MATGEPSNEEGRAAVTGGVGFVRDDAMNKEKATHGGLSPEEEDAPPPA